jgi:c-di-GMP-binding flagellar brake protein YcgR
VLKLEKLNTLKREARAYPFGFVRAFFALKNNYWRDNKRHMNALETLFVNQYVEIEDQDGNMLVGQIKDIEEDSFRIGSIISKYRVSVSGLVSQDVFVFFRGESGDRFQFKTKVISQVEKSPPTLQLAMPSDRDVLHVQQREYFRVPSVVKFEIERPSQDERIALETKDISGGGLSFLSKTPPFEENQSGLRGILYIVNGEDLTPIPFSARVVYVRPLDNNRFHTALEFIEIRESQRDKIIKFCMKEQLKHRFK